MTDLADQSSKMLKGANQKSEQDDPYSLLPSFIGIGLGLEKQGKLKMPEAVLDRVMRLEYKVHKKQQADYAYMKVISKELAKETLLAFNQAISDGRIQRDDLEAKAIDRWSHGVERGDMTADMTTMPVAAKKEYLRLIGACPGGFILAFRDLPEAQEIAYEVKQRTAKNIDRGSFAAQRAGKNADGWMLEDVLGDLVAAEEAKRAKSAAR